MGAVSEHDPPPLSAVLASPPEAGDGRDLSGREKPGALPRPLAAGHAQSAYQAGDLGYWSPGHDLAIYYRDDGQRIPAPAS